MIVLFCLMTMEMYVLGTHFADNYKTYLFRMTLMLKSIDKLSAQLVNEGSGREASKLIKVNGWYYLVRSIKAEWDVMYWPKGQGVYLNPYTEEKQLALPSVETMEPNQRWFD